MADISRVNAQVLDAVQDTQKAVNSPEIVWESGAGKAFQFVAQATAMAVQDATDNLRNVSTISTTAIAMAMTQLMSSGDVQTWGPVIATAQALVQASAADLQTIGENAAGVLRDFPPSVAHAEGKVAGDKPKGFAGRL
jgi:hypothetical protein